MTEKHTQARETRDARYDHLLVGTVVANDDPLNLGRVRVMVPGIHEPESPWAFPIGHMLGVKNGFWAVPQLDSNVVVFENQGDVDFPWYMPANYGAPKGVSDVPEQAQGGDVDVFVFRWRDFHVTFDGRSGQEKVTFEDLDPPGSGTKIEIARDTGKYLRDVEGPEEINVKTTRDVTVEEGDETHTVAAGKRTTLVQKDDTKTIVTGNKVDNVTAGDEVKTLAAGSSTESMPAGAKTIAVGLAVNIQAGAAVNITAGTACSITAAGAVSVQAAGIGLNSSAGTTGASTGLVSNTFVGGKNENVTGTMALVVSVLYALTAPLIQLLAALVQLGPGPWKNLVHRDLHALWGNVHTHPGVSGETGPPTQKVVPGGTAPNVDEALVTTQNVQGS